MAASSDVFFVGVVVGMAAITLSIKIREWLTAWRESRGKS